MKTEGNGNTYLATSIESIKKSNEIAARLRDRIVELVRQAGRTGLTISETERQIGDHKARSVSARFSELVRQRSLIRIPIGRGEPTRRFPRGSVRCVTRYDEETNRNVTVHWAPEFAPPPDEAESASERIQDDSDILQRDSVASTL